VYPALAAVHTLEHDPAYQGRLTDLVWVGSRGGLEESLVEGAGIVYRGISAAGLRGKNPLDLMRGLIKLGQGYLQSQKLLAEYRPDVLFVTGGYVCAPITVAAHRQGIPVGIYLPDIEPGQAIKFLSHYADRVAVTAPPAQRFFPAGLTTVTGYPVRAELYQTNPADARSRLNLASDWPVLLVFGGSQGARSINQAIANPATLACLLRQTQLVHISGKLDADWTRTMQASLPADLKTRYHLYPYLHAEMTDALVSADLIISRAGASVLGEATAVGAASILVPYPYSGAHQWANAQYLADQGAAVIIADEDLEEKLVTITLDLLKDHERRAQMGAMAQTLARPDAAQKLVTMLIDLSQG
jgi:UDP-N-acetylglucosamine--N-acetylmuramyl-(pentapeptide) pyrophosphoryl-undecaprenol N-acetylglucosamine transferase